MILWLFSLFASSTLFWLILSLCTLRLVNFVSKSCNFSIVSVSAAVEDINTDFSLVFPCHFYAQIIRVRFLLFFI